MTNKTTLGGKYAFLFFFIALTGMLSSCAHTPPIKSDNGVASLEKVTLGGAEQWILIRGKDVSNPIMLFIHGGPGFPEMAFNHHFGDGLEERFIVVHWDQRGAGKSYGKAPEGSFTVEQHLSDAHELIEMLLDRFGKKKLYIVGHSWGSMMGVMLVKRYPELFHAYVGIGQVVDLERNEAVSYDFVLREARRRNNRKAISELEKIGPPPYEEHNELVTQRKWLLKFGGALHNEDGYGKYAKIALKTGHEYSPADYIKLIMGATKVPKLMWEEMSRINFIEQAPRLEVPVYFFAGRYDYNTPFELVEEYYEILEAPRGKHLVWFENSAHSPNLEEPAEFTRAMVELVLAQTYPGNNRTE